MRMRALGEGFCVANWSRFYILHEFASGSVETIGLIRRRSTAPA
jgi:hypothetical protein